MTKRKVKVMLVAPLPPPVGGIATWTTLVLRAPADADIERIHVDTSIRAGYSARKLSIAAVLRRLAAAGKVCWQIVKVRPDVIHVTTSYDRGWTRDTLFLAVARALGSATILNIHGGDFNRMYHDAPRAKQSKILGQLEHCDAVVAITQESERFLKELGLTNVRLVPNCIDIAKSSVRPEREGTVRWLFVGYLTKAKGLTELFDALRRFPAAHLTLVGPAPTGVANDGADLVAKAAKDPDLANRFTHTGAVPPAEARAIYPNHDIFVFPTRREGFPNAVLEAMEAGLPIVATRVGAIPDMIIDGEHGLLVDTGDQDRLEAAIARVTADVDFAGRMGRAARARVSSLYEVGRVNTIWCELYRELAASDPGELGRLASAEHPDASQSRPDRSLMGTTRRA
ncbi:MAG: glycosyltransferase family 4 protein [Gemmatimonadaceae bacterium]